MNFNKNVSNKILVIIITYKVNYSKLLFSSVHGYRL